MKDRLEDFYAAWNDTETDMILCIRSGKPEEMIAIQKEFAPKFGIPVYCGFPFGHSRECCTIDFSRPVEIRNNTVLFPKTAR